MFLECLEENQICKDEDGKSNTACVMNKWRSRCANSVKCTEEDIVCTARDGQWVGEKICLEKKFHCDNFLQCEDGRDEMNCEEEYFTKGIFSPDDDYICKTPFLQTQTEDNLTGRFFPNRAVR